MIWPEADVKQLHQQARHATVAGQCVCDPSERVRKAGLAQISCARTQGSCMPPVDPRSKHQCIQPVAVGTPGPDRHEAIFKPAIGICRNTAAVAGLKRNLMHIYR